ncbi:Pre-mRNA splicing factor-domain-containing protein [Gymnopilus junonius]|uniref:Pre-mRNA splicing factor-domain-containing protein n=1 Tax=Gymnopilus junonius TaxID=109634 RepID=A0A9P5P293_GYMJU|nr:Pre-mRNA splicing factor-domain-containing protein [Gymnopilus junonius]
MGGGDLNMKKSWHPLLLKNQERVWLEEKKALEEKKKLDQLRKEKEEERQLQELQRLQEESTGKKRTEKLEWMYATPATGNSQNANDLEDYLLGKKRVDKILTADEHAKVGASHKNFIAVQNANSARDIAAKIREDPLLAIKQQEQAAYQALLSNPLRLAKMQKELGVKPKRDKKEKRKEKEERKRLKHHKHRRDRNSRTPSPYSRRRDRSPEADDYHRVARDRSPGYPSSSRSRSPDLSRRIDDEHSSRRFGRYGPESRRGRSRSTSPRHYARNESRDRYRGESPKKESCPQACTHRTISPPPPRVSNGNTKAEEDRAARLAAMTVNASSMSEERQKRLAALLEKEKAELEADEWARAQSKGMSGFLSQEQKRVFGGVGGLEDRIRRGKGGMILDAD